LKSIVIAGRTGKAAELRRTQSGEAVLGFSVAVDDGYGQNKRTLWFDCSVWGKRADALKDMLPKGKEVTVVGDLSTREHDGKTYLTVRVNELTLQGGKTDSSARQEQGYRQDDSGSLADELDDVDSMPF
jgi:single-strand DNA-binding protein